MKIAVIKITSCFISNKILPTVQHFLLVGDPRNLITVFYFEKLTRSLHMNTELELAFIIQNRLKAYKDKIIKLLL